MDTPKPSKWAAGGGRVATPTPTDRDGSHSIGGMGGLGFPELFIVLLVVLLLFGSTKLPKLAKSIGEASKEFKKGVAEGDGPEPLANEQIAMTRADIDAAIAERDAMIRKDVPPTA